MAITRLGWDVFTSSSNPRLTNSTWITGKVRGGDHKVVLDELCRRFDAEVENIRQDWSWGWNYRAVRGASVISEHAAGVAVDLNAPKHPLGKSGTFSSADVRSIHRILADLDNAVRWGGDYAGRKDEMHFELQGGNALMKRVADKIRGGDVVPVGNVKPKPRPKPKLQHGYTRDEVNNIIRAMNRMGLDAGVEDGDYGPMLTAAVKAFQKHHGLVVDGDYGKVTQARWFLNRKIQQALKDQGYTKQVVDGWLGAQTEANVRDFQKRTGLVVDGDPGPVTQKRLGI